MTDTPQKPDTQPIVEIMEDCQNWLSLALAALFYKEQSESFGFILPKSYLGWIDNSQTQSSIQKIFLDQVKASAATLQAALVKAKASQPPPREAFQQFMQAYEDFMARLNQIENDSLLSGHGIDSLTGFKNNSVLMIELKRELERRARRGNPFSVAMLRVDDSEDAEARNVKLRTISEALRRCIRSFDDVYRMGDTDLLIGLKHSDLKGGMRFIERLRVELKNLEADFTFSSCVAEPDPEDDMNVFLTNIEKDLTQIASAGGGQSAKYEDLSPLQRFVTSMKDAK